MKLSKRPGGQQYTWWVITTLVLQARRAATEGDLPMGAAQYQQLAATMMQRIADKEGKLPSYEALMLYLQLLQEQVSRPLQPSSWSCSGSRFFTDLRRAPGMLLLYVSSLVSVFLVLAVHFICSRFLSCIRLAPYIVLFFWLAGFMIALTTRSHARSCIATGQGLSCAGCIVEHPGRCHHAASGAPALER